MTREYFDFLRDIINNIIKIEKFVGDVDYDSFVKDEKTLYAVIRAIEIIGEASKQIPDDVTEKYTDVPWKLMAQMRDKLVHRYFGVNTDIVWRTITEEIPLLKNKLQQILTDLEL